jgi:hypothetical protein
MLQVARGKIGGMTSVNKFGRNTEIDSGVTADIWDGGYTVGSGGDSLLWVPPTTARTHALVSTDDEDGGAGGDTGALTVRVYGLDSSYAPQEETVTLNGTTNVNTANTYTMIHRMTVLTAGSAAANLGTIKATAATDGTVTARIRIGNNQTGMAIYQIPAGKTGYMFMYYGALSSAAKLAAANLRLVAKPDGEVWQVKHFAGIVSTASSAFSHYFPTPVAYDAKTIVKMQATPDVNDSDVTAGFGMILVDN